MYKRVLRASARVCTFDSRCAESSSLQYIMAIFACFPFLSFFLHSVRQMKCVSIFYRSYSVNESKNIEWSGLAIVGLVIAYEMNPRRVIYQTRAHSLCFTPLFHYTNETTWKSDLMTIKRVRAFGWPNKLIYTSSKQTRLYSHGTALISHCNCHIAIWKQTIPNVSGFGLMTCTMHSVHMCIMLQTHTHTHTRSISRSSPTMLTATTIWINFTLINLSGETN